MAKKRTDKQEFFCREFIIHFNSTKAAKDAGYSERTAAKQGWQLLQKPAIQKRIAELINERKERVEIEADTVLREIQKIAFADIKDFLSFGSEKVKVGEDDEGNTIWENRITIKIKDSDEVDGTMINEIQLSKDGSFKFKLHDKKSALNDLMRHLGLFNDKLDLTKDVEIHVTLNDSDGD